MLVPDGYRKSATNNHGPTSKISRHVKLVINIIRLQHRSLTRNKTKNKETRKWWVLKSQYIVFFLDVINFQFLASDFPATKPLYFGITHTNLTRYTTISGNLYLLVSSLKWPMSWSTGRCFLHSPVHVPKFRQPSQPRSVHRIPGFQGQ